MNPNLDIEIAERLNQLRVKWPNPDENDKGYKQSLADFIVGRCALWVRDNSDGTMTVNFVYKLKPKKKTK